MSRQWGWYTHAYDRPNMNEHEITSSPTGSPMACAAGAGSTHACEREIPRRPGSEWDCQATAIRALALVSLRACMHGRCAVLGLRAPRHDRRPKVRKDRASSHATLLQNSMGV